MLDFQQQQAQFAAHLRDPLQNPAPADVEERRLAIYRELFYNNVENFIGSGFPVLKSLFDEKAWHALVRDFYASHQAQSPYFLEISQEFLKYLADETLAIHQQFPFAADLAHYEWVELALSVAADQQEPCDAEGDLLLAAPLLSHLAWPLVYEWPVHLIGPAFVPQEKSTQPVCLVVYRNADDEVEFMEANPVTLRLLAIIDAAPSVTGENALIQLAAEMQQTDVQAIIQFGQPILEQLRALGIIAGTRLQA